MTAWSVSGPTNPRATGERRDHRALRRQGEHRGFAKITRDLTQRRQIEALEETNRRVNEFLAMLAHELRNPLAPIRNAISVMHRAGTTDPTCWRLADTRRRWRTMA
jgi:signal transduction histidine kinase